MFLGKLWVRIKGEFLAAREDVSHRSDARKTGEGLLKKIETIVRGETPERSRALESTEETYQSSSSHRQIHDLVDRDEQKKARDSQENAPSKSPSPNPRKLG